MGKTDLLKRKSFLKIIGEIYYQLPFTEYKIKVESLIDKKKRK